MTARLHEKTWTHEGRPHLMSVPISVTDGDVTDDRGRVRAPAGPWDEEPDKVQWVDAATNLDCLAVRNPVGAWCGYVGVPPGHPDHGKDYDDVEAEVHGGLTFAGSCREDAPEGHGICHIPLDGRPDDVWWLGFDCAHSFDLIPTMMNFHREMQERMDARGLDWPGEVYRDLTFVQEETSILAMQLALHVKG